MKRKISLVILTAALALASTIGLTACDDEQNTSCTEHAWDGGNVTREATCAEAGETTYTCTVCGETKTEPIAKSTTHSWDAGEVDQPDITVEGSITYTCTVCGDTYSETVPAHVEHEWDEGSQLKAPTCTETGSMKYECKICHTTKTEDIPATGEHRYDTFVGYETEPTCITAGSATYKCMTCEATMTKEVQPTGVHSLSWEHEGDQHWQECANCDYATDKEAHAWTETDRRDADCVTDGWVKCECKCGAEKTEDISATGEHHYDMFVGYVTEPTCITAGSATYKCMTCEATMTKEVQPTGVHSLGDWAIDTEATLYQTGSRHKECTACDYKTSVESYELDNFVSDYRSGIVSGNTNGWEYGHSDYKWDTPPTEGRLPGSTNNNNESFVFTKSEEFNGDAWLVKNNNNEVISEIKAGWLNGSWSTLAYTVGEGVENSSYEIALRYQYNPDADNHPNAYTTAKIRIAVLSEERVCKYSEFIDMNVVGTETSRTMTGLRSGDKIYVFIELTTAQSQETGNWSWSSGDFTCRIFEKQPEQTQDE